MVTRVVSREDGNLNQSTIVTSRTRAFKDIDLSFTAKPNGELYVKTDAAAVKQAVKNLILTNYYEKPFQPFYGSNIAAQLFELIGFDDDAVAIEEEIARAIKKYEPRAEVFNIDVNIRDEQNALDVTIEFKVINSDELVTFSTVISRLR